MKRRFRLLSTAALTMSALSGCSAESVATPTASGPSAAAPTSAAPTAAAPTAEAVALLTEPVPAQACMAALAQGTLVPDPRSGLALATAGERTPVMWPFGYSGRLVDGVIELLDDAGTFVAREGDTVEIGGGFGPNGFFFACARGIQPTH